MPHVPCVPNKNTEGDDALFEARQHKMALTEELHLQTLPKCVCSNGLTHNVCVLLIVHEREEGHEQVEYRRYITSLYYITSGQVLVSIRKYYTVEESFSSPWSSNRRTSSLLYLPVVAVG